MNRVSKRPAETGGLAAAVVALIVYGFGAGDPALVAPLLVVVGAVPAVVTWLVELLRGRASAAGD